LERVVRGNVSVVLLSEIVDVHVARIVKKGARSNLALSAVLPGALSAKPGVLSATNGQWPIGICS
jgi:hypothetical protein